eukprot:snap_masked-scaffold_1-processed-gene-14.17-mRNA-1 protein AED:1.00 eAED:1.00 QI:0/0/0/0/1/1/2/0/302
MKENDKKFCFGVLIIFSIFSYLQLLILNGKFDDYLHAKETKIFLRQSKVFQREFGFFAQMEIVAISTRGYSAEKFLDSLIHKGNWPKEKTNLILDNCFSLAENNQYAQMAKIVKIKQPRSVMKAKQIKTRVFDLIAQDFLFYMDSDLLVQRPIEQINPFHWSEKCSIYMPNYPIFPFRGRFRNIIPSPVSNLVTSLTLRVDSNYSKFNSGMMFLSRKHSLDLLQKWQEEINTGKHDMDQKALKSVLEKNKSFNICNIPDDTFFPAALIDRVGSYFLADYNKSFTFIHDTKSLLSNYEKRCIK